MSTSGIRPYPAEAAARVLAADPGRFGMAPEAAAAMIGFLDAGWVKAGLDGDGHLHFKATAEGLANLPPEVPR